CRHLDLAGQGGQPPLARPETALIGAIIVVQTGPQTQAADQVLDFAWVEAFVQVGCAESLGCELVGDRGVLQALIGQCPDPLGQRRVVRQLVDPGYRAEQSVWVWWPPAQVTVACTRSVAPSAVTWTDSTTARSSLLRSAMVVAGAAHSAGMSSPGRGSRPARRPTAGPGAAAGTARTPHPAAPARPARPPARARAGGPPGGSLARPAGPGAAPGRR